MPSARVRHGGTWLDTDLTGKVRFNGADLAYAPAGGPAFVDEAFTFPTPANPDWPDDPVNTGCKFATTAPGLWVGNRIWRAATPSGSFNGSPVVEIIHGWNADTETRIAEPTPIPGALPRAAFVDVMFGTPANVVPGVNYTAAYYATRYGFTRPSEGAVIPFLTPHLYTDGTVLNAVSFYSYGFQPGGGLPNSASSGFHFNLSPIVRYAA